MATFRSTRRDVAEVPHPVEAVWDILVDPDAVARMTPLVESIEVDDQGRWVWSLRRVPLPGHLLDLTMVEEMTFTPHTRIEFSHGPLERGDRAGAEGYYALEPLDGATRLSIELTITVQAPLPRLARAAVEPTMQRVLTHMGNRFAAAMLAELDRRR